MTFTCLHCGQESVEKFCCTGCEAAYDILQGMGLDSYYKRREIDAETRPLIPEESKISDFSSYIEENDATSTLHLMVDGLHCAACVWLIETVLAKQVGVIHARMNMSTRRLKLTWQSKQNTAQDLVNSVQKLGYRLMPYDPELLKSADAKKEKELLVALAIAGFASANVMLLSVSLWAGADSESSTRALFEWVSALITLPAAIYAGLPFYRSAVESLKNKRVNMDVPISLAVITACALSLYETVYQTGSSYYDSAITLLFFLLIGRYLDVRTKSKTRDAAGHLMHLQASSATRLSKNNIAQTIPVQQIQLNDTLLVARGEKFPADGVITKGESSADNSLMTGESLPENIQLHARVVAGAMNLEAPVEMKVTATGDKTTLAQISSLMEQAAEHKNLYTRMADKAAKLYAPLVHTLALLTFIGWWAFGSDLHQATVYAIAVLIVTCPCALALAVPSVQVAVTSRLMKEGVIVSNSAALEKIAAIDTVVFDKTGTLSESDFELTSKHTKKDLHLATSLALHSHHVLAKALAKHLHGECAVFESIEEIAGKGVRATYQGEDVKLGNAVFCDIEKNADLYMDSRVKPENDNGDIINVDTGLRRHDGRDIQGCEIFFKVGKDEPILFQFKEEPREDAWFTVQSLIKKQGLDVHLLSGDKKANVEVMAKACGITTFKAEVTPQQKHAYIESLQKQDRCVMMVGDGINDAPSLALADIGVSFAGASDIARHAADIIIQNDRLESVLDFVMIGRKAHRIVMLNFSSSLTYNVFAIPLAMAGFISPLLAAVLMSVSSLSVMANALRILKK